MLTLPRRVARFGLLLLAVTALDIGSAAQSPTQSPVRPPAAATRPPEAGRLPIRRVVLYKSGIGYFEHVGRVTGDQTLSIDLTSGQLDDVLKSLTTLDLGGGRISGITYNTEAPLEQRLGTLRLSLGASATRTALFDALRGARVEVSHGGVAFAGRLLSVETRARNHADTTTTIDEIVVVTDAGDVRTTELTPAVSVRMSDADLRQQVGQYLDLVASTRAQDLRRMAIATSGSGERQVFVSYVSAVPVWKTTYRLVVPSKAEQKPLLQGWAIVDNTLGEDWQHVELSLVAGAPQSFVQRISQPYYLQRPTVDLPPRVLLSPQMHGGTLAPGGPGVSGRVTDATGAALPGATVQVEDADRVIARAIAGADGAYTLAGVPPGRYTVRASLEGFETQSRVVFVDGGSSPGQVFVLPVGQMSESVTVEANRPTPRFRTGVAEGRARAMAGGPAPSPPPAPIAVDEVMRTMESAAQAADLGDLFEYNFKQPVTIRRNQSALVPIVQSDVTVEKVSLWNASSGRPRPLRAVWLTNSTGLTLDGGSVTLIEGEAFAGEGLIEPLKAGERRLLSYASDLAVLVDVKRDGPPQRVNRISIARGVVLQRSEDRSRATYTIRNEDAAARQVVIEHPVRAGWVLGPGVKPAETSTTAHRFKIAVEPRATGTLIVDESRPVETRYQVSSLTTEQVALIVKSQGADATIESRLGAIVAKQRAQAALGREMQAKREELARISEGQARVRENMKALKGSDAERDLVQRYTRQLSTQEDRIETLTRERDALDVQYNTSQAELNALIEALTLDVTVAGG